MSSVEFKPRLCRLRRFPHFDGYGFSLHVPKGEVGQHIGTVDKDSPAEAAGLKEGDKILEVNGRQIGDDSHLAVVRRIKELPDEVTILVRDTETLRCVKKDQTCSSGLSVGLRKKSGGRHSSAENLDEPPPSYHDAVIGEMSDKTQKDGFFASFRRATSKPTRATQNPSKAQFFTDRETIKRSIRTALSESNLSVPRGWEIIEKSATLNSKSNPWRDSLLSHGSIDETDLPSPSKAASDDDDDDFLFSRGIETIMLTNENYDGIQNGIQRLWETKSLSDIVISCQGQEFPCHKTILAINSEVIFEKLTKDPKMARLEVNHRPSMVEKCLEFVYLGKTEVICDDVDELADTAAEIGLGLYSLCRQVSLRDVVVVQGNCLEMWAEGVNIGYEKLINEAKPLALRGFVDLCLQRQSKMSQLPWQCAVELLSDVNLKVANEEQRLTAALSWIRGDVEQRKELLPSLLEALPLCNMQQWFLEHTLTQDALVTENKQAQEILQKTITAMSRQSKQTGKNARKSEQCLIVVGAIWDRGFASDDVLAMPFTDGLSHLTLTKLPASIVPHGGAACCSDGTYLFITGLGESQNESWALSLTFLTWKRCGDLEMPRTCHCMAECWGGIYVLGGRQPDTPQALVPMVEMYNGFRWQPAGALIGTSCRENVCACVSGSNILIYGVLNADKTTTLLVYSTIEQQCTSVLTRPHMQPKMRDWVYGLLLCDDDVVMVTSTGTYTCPLDNILNGDMSQTKSLPKYRVVNSSCAAAVNDDKIWLIGGKPRSDILPCYTYTATKNDLRQTDGAMWRSVREKWPEVDCYILGGAYCTVDVSWPPVLTPSH